MIGVIVQFQKWACVEKWKDTVRKWAVMKKCISPVLKICGGRKV